MLKTAYNLSQNHKMFSQENLVMMDEIHALLSTYQYSHHYNIVFPFKKKIFF